MRPVFTMIFAVIPTVISLTSGASAMSKSPSSSSFSAGCVTTSSKAAVPAGLCDAFVTALNSAGLNSTPATAGQKSDVTLVVTDATSSLLSARIDRGNAKGVEIATTRKGAPLDKAAFASFLNGLIAATPSLK